MSNEDIRTLETDCNSLNAIAGVLRHIGYNAQAGILLTIEQHIFDILDKVEKDDSN